MYNMKEIILHKIKIDNITIETNQIIQITVQETTIEDKMTLILKLKNQKKSSLERLLRNLPKLMLMKIIRRRKSNIQRIEMKI